MADLEELLREASGPDQHRIDVDDVMTRSRTIRRNRTATRVGVTLTGLTVALGFLFTATAGRSPDAQPAVAVSATDTTGPATSAEPTERVIPVDTTGTTTDPSAVIAPPAVTGTARPTSTSTSGPAAESEGTQPGGRPTPSGTGFDLVPTDAVPASLRRAEYASPTGTARLFLEADRSVAKTPLGLTGFVQGQTFTKATRTPTTIEPGTTFCVWFVHADLGGPGFVRSTIDFGRPILGLAILREEELSATSEFALEGRIYYYDGPGDTDEITVTGSVLELDLQVATLGKDQIRVFTSC